MLLTYLYDTRRTFKVIESSVQIFAWPAVLLPLYGSTGVDWNYELARRFAPESLA